MAMFGFLISNEFNMYFDICIDIGCAGGSCGNGRGFSLGLLWRRRSLRRRNCEPGQHHCKAKACGQEKVFILIVHLSPPCVICPISGYMGFNRRQGKRSSRFGDFWAFRALYANFAGDVCGWGACWYCKAQFCN